MEFIPLERYSKKTKNKTGLVEIVQNDKLKEVKSDEVFVKKTKTNCKPIPKSKLKVLGKKNVKNKYKETLALKQSTKKLAKKKSRKTKSQEENEEIKLHDNQSEHSEEVEEEEDDDDDDDEEEKDEKNEEEIFKKKCKEMDEKKKNRLFVKLRKKILAEAQIKELHPDIRSVIFPRKKNSRWCWAVFASEEKANKAMKEMAKNKEILVSKPNPYARVDKKNKEKYKTVLRKKEAKKKLQEMWM